MILAALAGAGLALLCLLPGLHPATMLLFVLPLLGGDQALVAAAVFTGMSTVLSILQASYHPVAAEMIANADIAAKLAYQGLGRDVTRTHQQAVRFALGVIILITLGAAASTAVGVDLLDLTARALRPWVAVILTLAVGMTVLRAANRLRTALVCLMAMVVGFMAFSHPALVGNHWAMTPLLAGLFMVPAAMGLIGSKAPLPMPGDLKSWVDPTPSGDQRLIGTLLGVATGFLAGIGTGSLVALVRQKSTCDFDALTLASAAEASNNCFALTAFALIGTSRSGVAAALAEAAPQTDPFSAVICCLGLAFGVFLGERTLCWLQTGYRNAMNRAPQRVLGLMLLVLALGFSWPAGVAGYWILGAAWMVSSLAKSWMTPNQALLTALIGPVLVYETGLTRPLAGALGIL